MLHLARTGLFKNQWLCWCENTSKNDGFYPCNSEGKYSRDIWGRSPYYACKRCGRIIETGSLAVVGLTKHFKLTPREIWNHLIFLRAARRKSLGVSEQVLERRLSPRYYLALKRFKPKPKD